MKRKILNLKPFDLRRSSKEGARGKLVISRTSMVLLLPPEEEEEEEERTADEFIIMLVDMRDDILSRK